MVKTLLGHVKFEMSASHSGGVRQSLGMSLELGSEARIGHVDQHEGGSWSP